MKTKLPAEVDCASCGNRVPKDRAISLSFIADICHDCIRECVKLMEESDNGSNAGGKVRPRRDR